MFKVFRPSDLEHAWIGADDTHIFIGSRYSDLTAEQARALAKWLTNAALYLEQKEKTE